MKKTLRLMCLVLAALLVSVLFSACAGNEDASSAPSAGDQGTSGGEQAGFPLEEKNWGGVTINIITHNNNTHTSYEFGTSEQGVDTVNDAFYERTALIEERYGLTTNVTRVEGLSKAAEDVELQVVSGTDDYDLVATGVSSLVSLGMQEYLYDYYSLDNGYINLDAEYWDQSAKEDLSIANKLFYITGDAVVSDDSATWVMYYNKAMIEDYDLANPIELVDNNEWTIDRMYELAREVAHKVGEGSTMSFDPEVGDVYGMVAQAYDGVSFMWGCDQAMITKDEDDLPILRIDDERNINAWQKVSSIMYDEAVVGVADFHGPWNSGVYEDEGLIFTNGNALFMPGAVSTAENTLNKTEMEYGILPMPKLDANQEEYASSSTVYWAMMLSIPTTNVEKLDATCYLLEAMAYWGQEICTPVYYDEALKLKVFNDEDSERMLDLIFDNRTYDLGAVYDFAGPNAGMLQFYTSMLSSRSSDIVSNYESKRQSFLSAIDAVISDFME